MRFLSRLRTRSLPLPPAALRFMREDDETYCAWGDEAVEELASVTTVPLAQSRVLDIGCGYGRLAHALLRAGFRGRYLGFDVLEPHVDWCAKSLGRPGVEFRHLDVRNERYNPDGALTAVEVHLDERFDLVALYSVFTHMWPGDVVAYLDLIRSALAPGGRALATFFLTDDEWRELDRDGRPAYPLPHRHSPSCRFMSEDEPLHVVGYDVDWVLGAVAGAGMKAVGPPRFGTWSGRPRGGPGFQDTVVLARADDLGA